MKKKTRAGRDIPLFLQNPGFHFVILLLANLLLSYRSISMEARLWLGLFGILLPLGLLFLSDSGRKDSGAGPWEKDLFKPTIWACGLVLLAGAFFRFYRLTGLSLWPGIDDGINAFGGIELTRKWDWGFFYSTAEEPPLFLWLAAAYFKCLPPSLFSLWLLPALIATATMGAGYWAARKFFPRSFSFLILSFLSLGFWPVFIGRFCTGLVLLPLWEFLTLGFLGGLLGAGSPSAKRNWSIGFALVLAGGFYIYPPDWIAAALWMGLVALVWRLGRGWRRGERMILLVVFLVVMIPFAVAVFVEGYGSHIRALWPRETDFALIARLKLALQYPAALFWGIKTDRFVYGPLWGGFLNPLACSLFLLGLPEIWRHRQKGWAKAWGIGFLLCLIPGIASHDFVMMRVLALFPFLIFLVCVGAFTLLSGVPKAGRVALLTVLLVFSFGLDFHHLTGRYAKAWREEGDFFQGNRSEESLKAYQVLEAKARRSGPGSLFLDYVSIPLDQTLSIAVRPFDAVSNSSLREAHPVWAAFLTNVNYRPFLEKRFPGAEWTLLGKDLSPWDGELMLGVLTMTDENRRVLNQWLGAQQVFHDLTAGIIRLTEGKNRDGVLKDFLSKHSLVEGDPFLESAFWEAAYFNHSAERKFQEAFGDLSKVLEKGYSAAHIYNEMGAGFWREGKKDEAKRVFEKAVLLGGGHTYAQENLKKLDEVRK